MAANAGFDGPMLGWFERAREGGILTQTPALVRFGYQDAANLIQRSGVVGSPFVIATREGGRIGIPVRPAFEIFQGYRQ